MNIRLGLIMVIIGSLITFSILGFIFVDRDPDQQLLTRNLIAAAELAVVSTGIAALISMREYRKNQKEQYGILKKLAEIEDSIGKSTAFAERIASGDFSQNPYVKDEPDSLSNALYSIAFNCDMLVKQAKRIPEMALKGEWNEIRDPDMNVMRGGFAKILERQAEGMHAAGEHVRIVMEYVDRFVNGEDLADIEIRCDDGRFFLINELRSIFKPCEVLQEELENLRISVSKGELSQRIHQEGIEGRYRKMADCVNATINMTVVPLNLSMICLRRISEGNIPEPVTDDYEGSFTEVKSSINQCVEGMEALLEVRDLLNRMSVNDYTLKMEGSFHGIFGELAAGINGVSERVRNTIRILNDIAEGDLSDLGGLHAIGKRSENDTLMPSMIKMMENIQGSVNEAAMLTDAVIQGKLTMKSDSEQFQGAWRELVDGMNHILSEVSKPLKEVSTVMEEMRSGRLQTSVNGSYQGDFDLLAQSINIFISDLRTVIRDITNTVGEIAVGNLAVDHVKEYKGDFANISEALNNIIDSLNSVMGDINKASEQVAAGSRQVSEGSQSLSQGSTEQASTVQELAASITEIASQTKQNALSANKANDLASAAKVSAEKGNGRMNEMLSSMSDISDSSVNISKIIKVIDDIAFQTNILALNAAVEAARAGQHGKGFAVVAEEVRSLAARSADAAKNTTELIESSIERVRSGTEIANETSVALHDIVETIELVAELVGDIAEASNEQATGIVQINKGLDQVSQVVQNNSATAEQSAAASEELSGQSELLKEMVGKFKLGDGFTVAAKNERTHSYRRTEVFPDGNSYVKLAIGQERDLKY